MNEKSGAKPVYMVVLMMFLLISAVIGAVLSITSKEESEPAPYLRLPFQILDENATMLRPHGTNPECVCTRTSEVGCAKQQVNFTCNNCTAPNGKVHQTSITMARRCDANVQSL